MSWHHLESGQVNGLPLDLYRSENDFMIRVDGLELMNSRWPRSEQALARVSGRCASQPNPRILIGGLGLGFTLAATLDEFKGLAEVTVAELSADILRWYSQHYKSLAVGNRDDTLVRFENRDVREVIATAEPAYDLILLDVDNGPEPVSGASNGALYTAEGLAKIRAKLRPGGALLLWSAFESESFVADAIRAGFVVDCLPVLVGLREHTHFIYCAFRDNAHLR